jgi:hypothetical protein
VSLVIIWSKFGYQPLANSTIDRIYANETPLDRINYADFMDLVL